MHRFPKGPGRRGSVSFPGFLCSFSPMFLFFLPYGIHLWFRCDGRMVWKVDHVLSGFLLIQVETESWVSAESALFHIATV